MTESENIKQVFRLHQNELPYYFRFARVIYEDEKDPKNSIKLGSSTLHQNTAYTFSYASKPIVVL